MIMKHSVLILAFVLLLAACQSADSYPENSFFWIPVFSLQKGDKEILVSISDPSPYTTYASEPLNPDRFEILISQDNVNFEIYSKLSATPGSYTIDNLTNGNPYYVAIRTVKNGFDPITSSSLMVIPSPPLHTETYLSLNHSIENLSVSSDGEYVSFITKELTNIENSGVRDSLYFSTSYRLELQGIDEAHSATWSNTENRIIYITNITEGNVSHAHEIWIFDADSANSEAVFQIDHDKYYGASPSFIPNSENISFFLAESDADFFTYEIWTLNPFSKETNVITHFENSGFQSEGNYDWTDIEGELLIEGRFKNSEYRNNIYHLNVNTAKITPVIESKWYDSRPSLSPDNSKVLFVSSRSGKNEVWLYDLNEKNLEQITGGSIDNFDPRYSNLHWLNNDTILLTVFDRIRSIGIAVSLE